MEPYKELLATFPDVEQLAKLVFKINAAGGPNAVRRIIDGELVISLDEKLFDKHGHLAGRKLLTAPTCEVEKEIGSKAWRKRMKVQKVPAEYPLADVKETLEEAFRRFLGAYRYAEDQYPFAVWQDEIAAIRHWIQEDFRLQNLLRGVVIPLLLPNISTVLPHVPYRDCGEFTHEFLVKAMDIHKERFPDRKRFILNEVAWGDNLDIVPESRYERLLERLVEEPAAALWFPTALRCCSPLAAREQMAALPEPKRLILGGGIEAIAATIGFMPEFDDKYRWLHNNLAAVSCKDDPSRTMDVIVGVQTFYGGPVGVSEYSPFHSSGLLALL